MVNFQEKVDDLIIVDEEIDLEVRSLETCAYSAQIFKETLSKIQKSVDDLSLRQYSNLHAWVGKLDEAVEEKLGLRLQVKNFVLPLPWGAFTYDVNVLGIFDLPTQPNQILYFYIIKLWSEAESFTIFENHVYSH